MSDQETLLQEKEVASVQEELKIVGKTAPARILEFATGHRLALPIHTTLEIVEDPEIFPVPGAAPHGMGILPWQESWIPVIDLGRLLLQQDTPLEEGKVKYVLTLAYQRVAGEPLEYCAVLLPRLPETVFVSDEMACKLPDDSPLWPRVSLSCFTYKGEPTPIVDTARLFGRSYETAE